MKYLPLVCICALCASPVVLQAQFVNGIQMLDQSYYLSAQWDESWWWSSPDNSFLQPYPAGDWSAGYDISPSGKITGGNWLGSSDGSPVALSVASPSPVGGSPLAASMNIGLFSVQNTVSAAPNGPAASFQAPIGGTVFYTGTIQTTVQASWLFSPLSDAMDVSIDNSFYNLYGSDYAGLNATLMDATTGDTLLNIANTDFGGAYVFAVNPNDLYQLKILGWSDTYASDQAKVKFDANIASAPSTITFVPEPEVCWLLPFGFAVLLGRKIRFGRV